MQQGHIYFHSPCFDGIVSAVLIWDFLESTREWREPLLHVVNYDGRDKWLSTDLQRPCAVVDFLYHPQADLWADHHLTTFVSQTALKHYNARGGASLMYDNKSGSCASLLWNRLREVFNHRSDRYREIVFWAEKIDSARYESVEEPILCPYPALRISLGLVLAEQNGYSQSLVRLFKTREPAEVADVPVVKERFQKAQSLLQIGLNRFRNNAHLENDGIVVFDVDGTGAIVSRYAPYYFFPHARYSVGIVRLEGEAKITAMRNPWLEFNSVPLGRVFEELGGGGHRRVASIVLKGEEITKANVFLNRILSFIRQGGFKAKVVQKA